MANRGVRSIDFAVCSCSSLHWSVARAVPGLCGEQRLGIRHPIAPGAGPTQLLSPFFHPDSVQPPASTSRNNVSFIERIMALSSKSVKHPSLVYAPAGSGHGSSMLEDTCRNKSWRIAAPKVILYLLAAQCSADLRALIILMGSGGFSACAF